MVTENSKACKRKWNKANLKNAACSVRVEEYEAFKRYAESQGKTVSGMLLEYIRSCIAEEEQG